LVQGDWKDDGQLKTMELHWIGAFSLTTEFEGQ